MIALSDVALMRPAFLLALPALIALALWLAVRGGIGDWRRAVDGPLFAALERRGAVLGGGPGRRFTAPILAGLVVALALSGPALRRSSAETFTNLDGLMVAVDLSRSMAEGGSLAEARISAMQVIEAAGGRQAGLIVYAGDAYLAATFTTDRAALGPLVAALEPGLVAEAGSAPARAIALAGERFSAAGIVAGDLVLVTDGGGLDGASAAAATALRAAGHRIHVLFVRPLDPPDGAPEADAAAADRIAAIGGGVVAPAIRPADLGAVLAEPVATRLARSPYAALGWFDLGRLLLLGALLPVLALFRRIA